jgi:hypothetical protein
MRDVRCLVLGCGLVSLAACQKSDLLTLSAAKPEMAIEAQYSHEGQSIVMRSFVTSGGGVKSEILDAGGRSISERATAALQRPRAVHDRKGRRTVELAQLFDDAISFSVALRLSAPALQELRAQVPAGKSSATLFASLEHTTATLRQALDVTRLALLQEWAAEARRQITMTPEEERQFYAIVLQRARNIRAAGSQTSPDLAALLGPERYAQYQARRKAFIPDRAAEVMP